MNESPFSSKNNGWTPLAMKAWRWLDSEFKLPHWKAIPTLCTAWLWVLHSLEHLLSDCLLWLWNRLSHCFQVPAYCSSRCMLAPCLVRPLHTESTLQTKMFDCPIWKSPPIGANCNWCCSLHRPQSQTVLRSHLSQLWAMTETAESAECVGPMLHGVVVQHWWTMLVEWPWHLSEKRKERTWNEVLILTLFLENRGLFILVSSAKLCYSSAFIQGNEVCFSTLRLFGCNFPMSTLSDLDEHLRGSLQMTRFQLRRFQNLGSYTSLTVWPQENHIG